MGRGMWVAFGWLVAVSASALAEPTGRGREASLVLLEGRGNAPERMVLLPFRPAVAVRLRPARLERWAPGGAERLLGALLGLTHEAGAGLLEGTSQLGLMASGGRGGLLRIQAEAGAGSEARLDGALGLRADGELGLVRSDLEGGRQRGLTILSFPGFGPSLMLRRTDPFGVRVERLGTGPVDEALRIDAIGPGEAEALLGGLVPVALDAVSSRVARARLSLAVHGAADGAVAVGLDLACRGGSALDLRERIESMGALPAATRVGLGARGVSLEWVGDGAYAAGLSGSLVERLVARLQGSAWRSPSS